MALTPITRKENFLARAAGNTGHELAPITREEHFLQDIIDAGGGGGSVTPTAVLTALEGMTEAQAGDALDAIGGEPETLIVAVNSETFAASETFSNILAAANAGTRVVFRAASESGMVFCLPMIGRSLTQIMAGSVFYAGTPWAEVYVLASDETGTFYNTQLALNPTTVTVTSATPTIDAEDNTIYECGELTSLTISAPPATGAYSIVFTSGATPTTTTFPSTVLGLEDFAAEANTIYEINVLDNRAVVGSWAVTV